MALPLAPSIATPNQQYSNPFGGTVPTAGNKKIVDEDYAYVTRPVTSTQPTPTNTPQTPETPRPVLTPSNSSNLGYNFNNYQLPQEDQIRQQEEQRARLQAQTEALNTLYDKQLAEQKQVYAGLTGQARAVASRGGRLESPIY